MKFIIGLIVGALVVAYYPTVGYEVRKITNTAANGVADATSEEAKWEKLYKDTIKSLQEQTQ